MRSTGMITQIIHKDLSIHESLFNDIIYWKSYIEELKYKSLYRKRFEGDLIFQHGRR